MMKGKSKRVSGAGKVQQRYQGKIEDDNLYSFINELAQKQPVSCQYQIYTSSYLCLVCKKYNIIHLNFISPSFFISNPIFFAPISYFYISVHSVRSLIFITSSIIFFQPFLFHIQMIPVHTYGKKDLRGVYKTSRGAHNNRYRVLFMAKRKNSCRPIYDDGTKFCNNIFIVV